MTLFFWPWLHIEEPSHPCGFDSIGLGVAGAPGFSKAWWVCLLSSHIGSHCFLGHRRGVPSPGLLVLGLVQELRKLVWYVREATCKLFITCLNYWANIDLRLWCPRSYLLFLRAHLLCGGAPLSGLGFASQQMGDTEAKCPPEGHGARSFSGDWALREAHQCVGEG